MKRFLLLALVILALGFGCLGHQPKPFYYVGNPGETNVIPLKVYKIWIDKEFGAADQLAIDDAIKQWNFALNGYVKLEVMSTQFDMEPEILARVMRGEGWVILKVNSTNSMVEGVDRKKDGTKSYTLGWANQIGGNRMYLIRDRLRNDWVMGVTLHEIGHLLGAEHDDIYLMAPHFHWEDARCVDYEAIKLVAAYQHIPLSRLNYCVYGAQVRGD